MYMAKDNKINVPSTGGGLMFYSGEDNSNLQYSPKLAGLFVAGLTLLIAIVQGIAG